MFLGNFGRRDVAAFALEVEEAPESNKQSCLSWSICIDKIMAIQYLNNFYFFNPVRRHDWKHLGAVIYMGSNPNHAFKQSLSLKLSL